MMSSFAVAVEQRRWQVVSLRLLLGVSRAAEALPRESLSELLDLLNGYDAADRVRTKNEGCGRES